MSARAWEVASADCAEERTLLRARVTHLEELIVTFAAADRAWILGDTTATIQTAQRVAAAEQALRDEATHIRHRDEKPTVA